jgi:hypothetical protein
MRARMSCSAISAGRCSQASSSGPYIGTTGSPRSSRWCMTAIIFAIAEADEELAVARLAFLAHGDDAALMR